MKKLFTCLGLLAFGFGASAQGISIYLPDGDEDVSGTTMEYTAGDDVIHQEFDVVNTTEEEITLRIERVKIMELEGTQDYLCWGASPETGACYSASTVSPENPFITPDASPLSPDDRGWLVTYHVANGVSGCAQYRYYIINESDERLDSVDVMYCSTVSIEEDIAKAQISVYPNPASEIVNVKLESHVNNVDFKLYNVLGDLVVSKTLNEGQNPIDVKQLPNGIYFYSVLQAGDIVETKKLVVRH